eukprot:6176045-Pleurochrysis_carterae.AAC.1
MYDLAFAPSPLRVLCDIRISTQLARRMAAGQLLANERVLFKRAVPTLVPGERRELTRARAHDTSARARRSARVSGSHAHARTRAPARNH